MAGDDPYFGKLPEVLLGKIATALPLKEAARTSVLSRPWRGQWKEWATSTASNRHFAGNAATKFTADGYPVSCFDTVEDFLIWVDRVIRRREPFPLRRPTRSRVTRRRTEFAMESLVLNFEPGDPDCGWIEFNKDRSSDKAPLVDGACNCCRSRAVSFLRRPEQHRISLVHLLSGRGRRDLLKRLTLRNCDMESLRSQLPGVCEMRIPTSKLAGPCYSFASLRSLVVQKGTLIETKFLTKLFYGCRRLNYVTLEDCSIVDNYDYPALGGYLEPCSGGRLLILNCSVRLLTLTRCTGVAEVMYIYGLKERIYDHPPTIHQQTVEFDFLLPMPPQPDEELPIEELPSELKALWNIVDDDDDEVSEPEAEEEDEVALDFYDRFDHNFS